MAPRCQRCVNMGRHCAYLEKASFPSVFLDFRIPMAASGRPRESQGRAKTAKLEPRWLQDGPRDRQDGQVGAKREPTWLQDGPRCAKMEPRERQDGAKMAKSEAKWSQHGSKMPKMRQHGPTLCLSRKSSIFLWFLLVLEAQGEPQVA